MGHYQANLRDIEFNLFEALKLGPVLDSGSVGELDSATTREILAEVARFARAGVLRGQDRRRAVLCRQCAARDHRDARHLGPHLDRLDVPR
jgi:Acyl-CoA dehydrogenase N terminal